MVTVFYNYLSGLFELKNKQVDGRKTRQLTIGFIFCASTCGCQTYCFWRSAEAVPAGFPAEVPGGAGKAQGHEQEGGPGDFCFHCLIVLLLQGGSPFPKGGGSP